MEDSTRSFDKNKIYDELEKTGDMALMKYASFTKSKNLEKDYNSYERLVVSIAGGMAAKGGIELFESTDFEEIVCALALEIFVKMRKYQMTVLKKRLEEEQNDNIGPL